MNSIDERLNELNKKIYEKKRLSSKIQQLRARKEYLSIKVKEFETIKFAEEDDVNKLEGRSLYKFLYTVIGQKDKKLDKEIKEAYEAKIKYELAVKSLKEAEKDLSEYVSKSASLSRCEEEYEALLLEKKNIIKNGEDENSQLLRELEASRILIESQIKEINEAISAGKRAVSICENIISSLDSAEGWGTYDLIGGGIISSAIKHSHLDDAQDMTEELSIQLGKFKTELADIKIDAEEKVNIDGLERFADYFLDGLLVDLFVLDKIRSSLESVTDTRNKIAGVIHKLDKMQSELLNEQDKIKSNINKIIING